MVFSSGKYTRPMEHPRVPSLNASQSDRFQCDVANCLGEGFGAQLLKASMQGSQDIWTLDDRTGP